MNSKVTAAYRVIQDAFDKNVTDLNPEEYRDVIDQVLGYVKSCEDCLREENPELFNA